MKVKINLDMYSMCVTVVTTFDEFKKLHNRADERDLFITTEYGSDIYVFVSNEWNNMYDHRFVQCLSHELNHAAMCVLNCCGIKFDYQNQEPLCYLQDHFMAKVFKQINKANKEEQ